jgi:glycosyltransferase involved in cell wall biosynthesis
MGYLKTAAERRLAFGLEDFAYRGAAAITTVSPGLVDLLDAKRSAAGRVQHMPNGVDVDRFDPRLTPEAARQQLGWDEAFTVVYAGTVGLAQGVGSLLEAARLVAGDVRIRIVGEGVEKPDLVARSRELGLGNVTFHGSVPPAEVPLVLAAADAGLVMLRRGPLYEGSLPTKLLETMAAARPVIVSADGLSARIVESSGAGYCAAAEDPVGLAGAIDAARRDPQRTQRGMAGRARAEQDYGRAAILDRIAALLRQAARPA